MQEHYRCNMWMAEQPATPMAHYNYIILREPRTQIISQYFHCKESVNHYVQWWYMPNRFVDWLQLWVDAMPQPLSIKHDNIINNKNDNATEYHHGNYDSAARWKAFMAHARQHMKHADEIALGLDKFRCYDPRNIQTRFAGYNWRQTQLLELVLEHLQQHLQQNDETAANPNSNVQSSSSVDWLPFMGPMLVPFQLSDNNNTNNATRISWASNLFVQSQYNKYNNNNPPETNKIDGGAWITNRTTVPNDYYHLQTGRALDIGSLNRDIEASLREDLYRRFRVVGDNSEMTTTVCLIFIRYTAGAWIPPRCIIATNSSSSSSSSTKDSVVENDTQNDKENDWTNTYTSRNDRHRDSQETDYSSTEQEAEEEEQRHRRLKIHFHGHGVRHHGNAYSTTQHEEKLIQRLTRYDQVLYRAGKAVFERQIREAEQEYNIRLVRGGGKQHKH